MASGAQKSLQPTTTRSNELHWTYASTVREVRVHEPSKERTVKDHTNAMREGRAWARCPYKELC